MRIALATTAIGAGVAVASAFASSLGLTTAEQQIAFGSGVVLVVLGIALLVTKRRERGPAMDQEGKQTVSGDRNIINPSGGTNITGDVHMTAPQPSVRALLESENEKTDDGSYMTIVRIHLDAPYAAKNLVVQVRGDGIKTYGVNRVDPSASISTGGVTYKGQPATIVAAPLTTDYRVFIATDGPASGLQVDAVLDAEVS